LSLDAVHDFVNSAPLVLILCYSAYHTKRLEDVDNVVYASPFDIKLFGARVK